MDEFSVKEFERLVRAYLAGKVRWDDVHRHAIEMEWKGSVEFPDDVREPLVHLHMLFLTADEADDAQFRAGVDEIADIVRRLDEVRGRYPGEA